MSAERRPVDVAVGILIRRDGALLLASRPEGKPYPGYWEFPGGKIEPGETVAHALRRELHEELGIDLRAVMPWVVRVHDYPHALVRLFFCRVLEWDGEPHAREGQRFGFFALDALPAPLLPATIPVLRGLELPSIYAISAAAQLGVDAFLSRLATALARGLRLVQLREPQLPAHELSRLFNAVLSMTRAVGARLLVSSRHPRAWWDEADGVHLTAEAAAAIHERPACRWVAVSVHDASELRHANQIGADFAVLGPVQRTSSHDAAAPLGWQGFQHIAADTPIPVFALGGLALPDLDVAMQAGAHGVALLSGAWLADQCFTVGVSLGGVSLGGVSSASSAGAPGRT